MNLRVGLIITRRIASEMKGALSIVGDALQIGHALRINSEFRSISCSSVARYSSGALLQIHATLDLQTCCPGSSIQNKSTDTRSSFAFQISDIRIGVIRSNVCSVFCKLDYDVAPTVSPPLCHMGFQMEASFMTSGVRGGNRNAEGFFPLLEGDNDLLRTLRASSDLVWKQQGSS